MPSAPLTTELRTSDAAHVRDDILSGVTVALVAIPQCMAFAVIAGLDPAIGLVAAVVMGAVGALLTGVSQIIIGPAVTTSTMVFAVLIAVTRGSDHSQWPMIAAWLAIFTGVFTIILALLNVGHFVRFVSRSVLVGLTGGAAMLIIGSQLGPALGISLPSASSASLISLVWNTMLQIKAAHLPSIAMSAATAIGVLVGGRLFGPRFPSPFLMIVAGAVVIHQLGGPEAAHGIDTIKSIPRTLPFAFAPMYSGPLVADLFVGAASIALIGVIQSLAIGKVLARRHDTPFNGRRELITIGLANLAAGVFSGFPGSASFSRSALADMTGARSRLAGLVYAIAITAVALLAARWAAYVSKPAIAGLLFVTAISIVDWTEFRDMLQRGGQDRIVLVSTLAAIWIIPIHWAIMLGLLLSIVLFLGRVSELHLSEMIATDANQQQFREQKLDETSGTSRITMLQVEGPLFFAHSDEIDQALQPVLNNKPAVLILRMRRTHQIDFSVIAVMEHLFRRYQDQGGHVIICGLTHRMRGVLRRSTLGKSIPRRHFIQTTDSVFGSARQALNMARTLVTELSADERPMMRMVKRKAATTATD